MRETNEEDSENKEKRSSFRDIAVGIGAIVVGVALGRLFGFAGIGAAAVGWFAYKKAVSRAGLLIGIVVGLTAGLATYGLAAVGLAVMLN